MAKKRTMTRQGGPVFYHAWKQWEEDQSVTGTIVGTSIDKKYKRKNYHVKVEEFDIEAVNQNDEAMEEGDTLVLNGCGILEKHLANCVKGDALQVVYKGMVPNKDGEDCHSIEVYLEESSLGESASDDDDDEDDL